MRALNIFPARCEWGPTSMKVTLLCTLQVRTQPLTTSFCPTSSNPSSGPPLMSRILWRFRNSRIFSPEDAPSSVVSVAWLSAERVLLHNRRQFTARGSERPSWEILREKSCKGFNRFVDKIWALRWDCLDVLANVHSTKKRAAGRELERRGEERAREAAAAAAAAAIVLREQGIPSDTVHCSLLHAQYPPTTDESTR